jgi:hypothetical protein
MPRPAEYRIIAERCAAATHCDLLQFSPYARSSIFRFDDLRSVTSLPYAYSGAYEKINQA